MKNIYLTLLGAFFTMLPCKSQTLSDGKVWNFVQRMYEHEDIERAYTGLSPVSMFFRSELNANNDTARTTSCRYHHSPCSSSLSCRLG